MYSELFRLLQLPDSIDPRDWYSLDYASPPTTRDSLFALMNYARLYDTYTDAYDHLWETVWPGYFGTKLYLLPQKVRRHEVLPKSAARD